MMDRINLLLRRLADYAPGILAAGVSLRLVGIMSSAIWYDEAITLRLAEMGLGDMIRLLSRDFSPGVMWELLVWAAVQAGMPGLAAARGMAAACSLATLALAWQMSREMHMGRGQQFAAVILLSLLPGQFWMAQDGRPYSLLAMLYMAASLFAVRRRWVGTTATAGLMMYTHNAGAFYGGSALALAWLQDRRDWKKLLLAAGAVGLAYLPWLPTLIWQMRNAHDYWLRALSLADLYGSLQMAFFAGSLRQAAWMEYAALLLPVSLLLAVMLSLEAIIDLGRGSWAYMPGLFLGRLAGLAPEAAEQETDGVQVGTLAVMALLPLAGMLAVSLSGRNLIYYRPLMPLLAPMALWLAAALWPRRLTWSTWALPYTWLLLLGLALAGWSPAARGGGVDQLALLVRAGWQPGDVILYSSAVAALPFDYYLADKESYLFPAGEVGQLDIAQREAARFGLQPIEIAVNRQRTWIVWSKDEILSAQEEKIIVHMAERAQLVGMARFVQAPRIEVWLLDYSQQDDALACEDDVCFP